MSGFFKQQYYGNTVAEWVTAGAVILGTFIGIKVVYFVFSRVIRKLTEKTTTRLDDVLVDVVESPVVAAITVGGIWIGVRTLNLPESGVRLVDGASLFCIVMCITWVFIRVIDAVFAEVLAPLAEKTDTDLDDQLLPVARKGSKLIVWVLGTIVALNNAGYNVGAVLAGLGIGGLALAMAARDTVANVFGGVTVFADRPFAVNDRIRISGYEGFVREIGIRSTRIETMDGPYVIIPNARFSESAVENVSIAAGLRSECVVGLTYDTEAPMVQRAKDIVEKIIEDHAETKLWDIGFESFGDFSLNIRAVYYVTGERRPLPVQSEVNMAVLEQFTAEGLDFAFPTQTLHVQSEAGDDAKPAKTNGKRAIDQARPTQKSP